VKPLNYLAAICIATFSILLYGIPCNGQGSAPSAASTGPDTGKSPAQRKAKPPYAGMANRITPPPASPCYLTTSHKYKDSSCFIVVRRDQPGSPLPITVPKGTNVEIRVEQRKPLENIQFTQTTDALPQPDLGLALVKAFSPGISAIIGHVNANLVAVGPAADQEKARHDLKASEDQLNTIADELSCLKQGKQFVKSTGDIESLKVESCGDPLGNGAAYDNLRFQIIDASAPNELKPLPESDLKALDSEIAAFYTACGTLAGTNDVDSCLSIAAEYQKSQYGLDTALTRLQSRQTALAATRAALDALPDAGDFINDIASAPDHKATIKITAKDVFSGASVDVGSVVITWQGSNISISTGILLSNLPNRTFANTPIIINGVPKTDPSGKVLTMVTETDTKPSVVTPLAFFNYELPWVTAKEGKFGILLSGGIGANLSAKTADYAAGISFRYREVLFTPAVHFGRENELTNGVVVGQMLGSSPPALPTEMHFKANIGFAITYRIPIP
jgi:hypothetical protein